MVHLKIAPICCCAVPIFVPLCALGPGLFHLDAAPNPTSTQTQKYRNMKARLRTHAVVANPRHSHSYVCALRLGLSANPSLSFCSDTSVSEYQAGAATGAQELQAPVLTGERGVQTRVE